MKIEIKTNKNMVQLAGLKVGDAFSTDKDMHMIYMKIEPVIVEKYGKCECISLVTQVVSCIDPVLMVYKIPNAKIVIE